MSKVTTLSGTVKLSLPAASVPDLIHQDPMGEIDKLVEVTISGHRFLAEVGGYAASGGWASLTLYLDSTAHPADESKRSGLRSLP